MVKNIRMKYSITVLAAAIFMAALVSGPGCGSRGSGGITGSNLGNQAPAFTSVTASKSAVLSNGTDSSTISVAATDANGDAITYSWSTTGGTLTRVSDTQYTFTANAAGSYTVTISATDSNNTVTTTSTTINSFGAAATLGGVSGTFSVPRSSYRVEGPTDSGNILDVPLNITASSRDLSRAVVFANKPAPAAPCSQDNFVVDEVIVKPAAGVSSAGIAQSFGLSVKKSGASGIALMSITAAAGLPDIAAKTVSRSMCEALNSSTSVAFADLNGINKTMATTPNDPRYGDQWHYPLMNLPQAWDITTGSASVIVAVLDTGIVAAHPDLTGRLVSGYDFVSDVTGGCDGDGIDSNPEDVSDMRCVNGAITSQDPRHGGYHGLHVAGTIGAATNNGVGVAGVDWSAKIMPIRVLGAGGGTDYDIAQGMLYASGLTNDSGTTPAQKANIINMSLGGDPGESCSTFMNGIFDQVYNAGVTVFVAGGNESSKTALNPTALCNHAIAVAAVGRDTVVAPYSNQGPGLTIAAPGGNQEAVDSDGILSTMRNNSDGASTYKYYQGTSMATPHAAGLGALMLAANPNLTPSQIAQLLAQTSTDLGDAGTDDVYGAGLVNAYKAVFEAKKLNTTVTVPASPAIAISTDKLYFSENETSKTVVITNTGGGTLSLTSVSDSESSGGNWMTTSTSTASDKITLTIAVDRTNLSSGTYTGSVYIASNGGNTAVAITMQVNAPTPEPPVGCVDSKIYILAVKSDDFTTAGQSEANITASGYQMFEVPGSATYYIIGGTDCNGDDYICDQDIDLCGAYPLLEDPSVVSVTGQQFSSNIDFVVTTIGGSASRPAGGQALESLLPRNGLKRMR